MNNGRFDLKRKLAFVAALAFTANSAYSVPAAGAETSAAVMSIEPDTVDAPDDIVPPPVRDSDDDSNNVVYTIRINNSDIDDDPRRLFPQRALHRNVFAKRSWARSSHHPYHNRW